MKIIPCHAADRRRYFNWELRGEGGNLGYMCMGILRVCVCACLCEGDEEEWPWRRWSWKSLGQFKGLV